jgi:hypothetical protein
MSILGKFFVLASVTLVASAGWAEELSPYSGQIPLNIPIKVWARINPDGHCQAGLGPKPVETCKAPRGNLFHAYGEGAKQWTLKYVDTKTSETKECRISGNSTLTFTEYLGTPNYDMKVSYRNSSRFIDRAWQYFDLSELPMKVSQENASLPLCRNGDDYIYDGWETGAFWNHTLVQDFGFISDYRLGSKQNPYDKPIPTHQVDSVSTRDGVLTGVVMHGWAALQDATKIVERFDAETAKEILRTGNAAHPEQATFTNEQYAWDMKHLVGDRYFTMNGICFEYFQMQFRNADTQLCENK